MGTGGGFPGLPLKILWPQLRVTLTDSIGKKTAFLKAAAEALGLTGVEVLTARAEELGRTSVTGSATTPPQQGQWPRCPYCASTACRW